MDTEPDGVPSGVEQLAGLAMESRQTHTSGSASPQNYQLYRKNYAAFTVVPLVSLHITWQQDIILMFMDFVCSIYLLSPYEML